MALLDESRCVCDRCGQRGEPAEWRRVARDKAYAAGWDVSPDEMLCPECRMPGFSADGSDDDTCDPCAKCGHGNASVKWEPAMTGPSAHVLGGSNAGQERMLRTCNRCGYSWDEAMPQLAR